MRRLISITLLLLFSLPLITPLFALGGTAESRLPACCRRNGAHHCMMSAEEMASLEVGHHFSAARSKCPMFPQAVAPVHHDTFGIHLAAAFYAGLLSHPAQFYQVESWARVALAGARQKRGPPAIKSISKAS